MNWMDDDGVVHHGIGLIYGTSHPRVGRTRKTHKPVTCLWCVLSPLKKARKRKRR